VATIAAGAGLLSTGMASSATVAISTCAGCVGSSVVVSVVVVVALVVSGAVASVVVVVYPQSSHVMG